MPQAVIEGMGVDGENVMPAMPEALRTADHVRDIRRRVNEVRSREERERAAREEREEAADREIGAELQQMVDADEPAAKKHRGSGLQAGGHYIGATSGTATASQVSKYKHTHSKAQTKGAKGAYVREGGMVVQRRNKASSRDKSSSPKLKSPSPKTTKRAKTPSPRAPSPPSPVASPPKQTARTQPKRTAKKSSRGDQSIFDKQPDSPARKAKVVDKRKETAERRQREAEEATKPNRQKRKGADPDVAKARAALKENKYRKGGLGDFKRFWDQRIVSEKRKLTQAEAKELWDRQRAYDGGVAERKAEREREKELERANKGLQTERFNEKHRSKIPKKNK
jgi:hypothetical protein